MNTNAIRDVATKARVQLMEGVERRCLLFDVREGAPRDAETVGGRVLSADERKQRRDLLTLQESLRAEGKPGSGHAALVEQAAYTWFNRLFAIRFMETNDRLPSHVRMLSAQDGSFQPECLREAMDLTLGSLDCSEAARLVAEGDDEGLFRLVLLAQCAELAECMPGVFERVGSAMELLLPDGLLAQGGVVDSLVTGIPEDDWREGVEIVGWAYQFYVSERKDEFFKSKRKAGKDDIAPATQLFTPEYIVRFLVQNSLGRLWVLNNPTSPLADQMEYFVKPDPDSCEDFRQISSPEEITLIDPACGSGHFLCHAFDLLAAMYEERGYRRRDIPQLILEKNLTGIEIDRRAAALTSFALTMKACEWDGRFLRRGVAPRVMCLESVVLTPEEREAIGAGPEDQTLVDVLAHLGEVGSLWHPTSEDVAALGKWSERATGEAGLFAGMVTEKLACAQKYVQALSSTSLICATNPPYMGGGNLAPWMSGWVRSSYPDEKADLCTCFIKRGFSLASSDGYNAQVTMQSWMFLGSFQKMRKEIIANKGIATMAHLGARAFDAIGGEVVQTTATVFANTSSANKGIYLRLVDERGEGEKEQALKTSVANPACVWRHEANVEDFKTIPGWPIAYWASKALLDVFRTSTSRVSDACALCKGMATMDNNRFLRLWYEVSWDHTSFDSGDALSAVQSKRRWFPYNKGGAYRRWYGNRTYLVNWENDGIELKNFIVEKYHGGSYTKEIRSERRYFQEGITWSTLSTGPISMRFSPEGFLFDSKGSMGFTDTHDKLLYVLAFLNSSVAQRFLEFVAPTLDYNAGPLGLLPYEDVEGDGEIVNNCISLSRTDYDSFETSWDFTTHPLARGNRISSAYGLWSAECKDRFDTLRSNEEQLNAIFARIYHMEGEVPIEVPEDKVSVRRADLERDVKSLISYAVGCMFGRYSLDKPGLVLANQGDSLPQYLEQVPHPHFCPDEDGILPITDDEYFEDDIVALFVRWVRVAYGAETLEENLRFVADALGGSGPARKVIRDYFMNGFFADHCAAYGVPSAGKRPIYWLLDSGRLGGFRALVYMHRYTPDLLARVRTDYVHERQERYRSRIAELEDARAGASRREVAAMDRELKRLRAQLDEVTKFEERLHHLADQMIEIDLDDGFKVNYAKFSDVMAKVK